jgi:SAM-dependent methyltransferase
MKATPTRIDRFTFALQALDIKPNDQVLEIGCGRGLMVEPVCDALGRGRLVAIDRSKTMIAAARKKNRVAMADGKVEFQPVALADGDFGRRRFTKIFAVNVNLFWLDPTRELAVIRKVLRPGGGLYLIFEPPGEAKARHVIVTLKDKLKGHDFAAPSMSFSPPALFCVIASPT